MFSTSLRLEAGEALWRLQNGLMPLDWKPMPDVGAGVSEIRLRDEAGIYRIFYVAKYLEGIYVLHCFEKKTQKTDLREIDLARARLDELMKGRRDGQH